MDTNTQKYSCKVLVGSWQDQSILEAVDLNDTDQFLKYGQDLQLVSHFTPWSVVISSRDGGRMSLSCGIYGEQLYTGLGPGSPITASSFTDPCVRNCFKIRSLRSGCEEGKFLKFGDVCTISPSVSSEPLFVTAPIPRLHTVRGKCGHPTLRLAGKLDRNCQWTVVQSDASMQMGATGLRIPNGCRVILKQTSTNQNMAVESNFQEYTHFGNEYEVSTNPCPNGRGRNKIIWQLISSNGHPEIKSRDLDHHTPE